MSFGRTGFGQFSSQSTSPGWGSHSTAPRFGIQPSATGSSAFNWGSSSTSVFAPQSSTGFFSSQSSTGWFNRGQSTGGLFTPGPSSSTPSVWQNTGFQPGQQSSVQTGNQYFQQASQPQPVSQNPFRDQFRAAVVRKDKRPISHVTKLTELEDNGQRAIQLLLDEVSTYEKLKTEFKKEPWFQKQVKISDLENEFQSQLGGIDEGLAVHKANMDDFGKVVLSKRPGVEMMNNALKEANQIRNELDELRKGGFGLNRPITANSIGVRCAIETPNPFVLETVKRLNNRFESLLNTIKNLEEAVKDSESSSDVPEDEFVRKLMKEVEEVSIALEKSSELIADQVEQRRERFLNDLRRTGDLKDPFKEADEKEKEQDEKAQPYVQRPEFLQPIGMPVQVGQAPQAAATGQWQPSSFQQLSSTSPWQSPAFPSTGSSTGFFSGSGLATGTGFFPNSSSNPGFGTGSSGATGFGNTTPLFGGNPSFGNPASSTAMFGSNPYGGQSQGPTGFQRSV